MPDPDPASPGPDPQSSLEPRSADAAGRARRGAEAPAWRQLFAGSSASAILRRIERRDPLRVRARCLAWLDDRARMLDAGRLEGRALARIAYAARSYEGEPPLEGWLDELVDRSACELLDEDRRRAQHDLPPEEPLDPVLARLAVTLGIEPGQALAVCVAFNVLPLRHRRAFSGVVLRGEPIAKYAARIDMPLDRATELLREALLYMATLGEEGGPWAEGDGT